MTNNEIAALVLPWAKEQHPTAYAKTLAVASREAAFRLHLLRLVEIRCEREPAWRGTVPLDVLHETSLTVTVRHTPSDQTFTVGGTNAPPGSCTLRFHDLTWLTSEDIPKVLDSIRTFEAERV